MLKFAKYTLVGHGDITHYARPVVSMGYGNTILLDYWPTARASMTYIWWKLDYTGLVVVLAAHPA